MAAISYFMFRAKATTGGKSQGNGLMGKLRYYIPLYEGQIASYKNHKGSLLFALFLSFVFQLQVVTTTYLVGKTLTINLPWDICILCVPLATLATMLPLSINGIGVRESAYVFLLTRSGLNSEQSFIIGLGTFVFGLVVSIIGGTIALQSENKLLPVE